MTEYYCCNFTFVDVSLLASAAVVGIEGLMTCLTCLTKIKQVPLFADLVKNTIPSLLSAHITCNGMI